MVSKFYKGTLIPWGKTLWTVAENKSQQIEIQHHSTEFRKTISLPFRIHWTGQPGENHISLERATTLHLRCFYWCNISVSHICNYLNFMYLRNSNPLTSLHRWKNWEMVQGSGLGAGWVSSSTAPTLWTAALRAAASPLQEIFVCSWTATKSLLDSTGHVALQLPQTTEASLNPYSERGGINKAGRNG